MFLSGSENLFANVNTGAVCVFILQKKSFSIYLILFEFVFRMNRTDYMAVSNCQHEIYSKK